ncbi:MAG: respiratory nitrate reductase subunit gamma [Deltaproteobacteria bacterium]|nr:respiratory nitrate reductase subunit gamma [Deltaproteobacteria bacterium]
MSGMAFVVGGLMPYAAAALFLAGMVSRFRAWYKTPQPAKMTLFPAAEGGMWKDVLAETFFFPSLFKGDRVLWGFAWFFHATLAFVFVGHVRVFTGLADRAMLALGMSPETIDSLSAGAGGVAGIVLLATGVLLLVRRLGMTRVREISAFSDYFALLLLLAIIVTGDFMRFGGHFELADTRAWAFSLLTFSPEVPPKPMFLLHILFAQLLFMYIPFSKILHFGGIFFTHALIKRR